MTLLALTTEPLCQRSFCKKAQVSFFFFFFFSVDRNSKTGSKPIMFFTTTFDKPRYIDNLNGTNPQLKMKRIVGEVKEDCT